MVLACRVIALPGRTLSGGASVLALGLDISACHSKGCSLENNVRARKHRHSGHDAEQR